MYEFRIQADYVNILGDVKTFYPHYSFYGRGRDYADAEADAIEQFMLAHDGFCDDWTDIRVSPVEADSFA